MKLYKHTNLWPKYMEDVIVSLKHLFNAQPDYYIESAQMGLAGHIWWGVNRLIPRTSDV